MGWWGSRYAKLLMQLVLAGATHLTACSLAPPRTAPVLPRTVSFIFDFWKASGACTPACLLPATASCHHHATHQRTSPPPPLWPRTALQWFFTGNGDCGTVTGGFGSFPTFGIQAYDW